MENSSAPYGKSDSFFFTVIGTAGAVDEATATVQIGANAAPATTASRTFYLNVPEATSLSAVPYAATLGPSLQLELKASAVLTAGGAPVANEVVSFAAGSGTLCKAKTDSSGVASCTGNAVDPLLNDGYTARFAGTDLLDPSSASARLLSIAGIGL